MLTAIDSFCSIVVVIMLYRWVSLHQLLVKPLLFHIANLLFLLGMTPWLDSIARYSIWLHSTQSVIVHHIAPLLWIMALRHSVPINVDSERNRPSWKITTLLVGFALLTWLWMLPAVHPLLMQSAIAYSGMKWLMAMSGIALCLTMLTHHVDSEYWRRLNSWTVTLPLVSLGVLMVTIPDIYQSAHANMHHHHMMMANVPESLQFDSYSDQLLGGMIFLLAASIYWQKDMLSRGFSGHTRSITE